MITTATLSDPADMCTLYVPLLPETEEEKHFQIHAEKPSCDLFAFC